MTSSRSRSSTCSTIARGAWSSISTCASGRPFTRTPPSRCFERTEAVEFRADRTARPLGQEGQAAKRRSRFPFDVEGRADYPRLRPRFLLRGVVLLLKRCGIIITVVTLGALALAQGAMADPVNAKQSQVIPASCDNGQSYEVVVNGNGEFTPGHVVGSTSMFIPQAFDLTFEFTPTGGSPESETDTSAKHNVHGDVTTCSIDFTQTFPEGSFHLFGTVTGF